MKAITTISLVAVAPTAMAHTGDHSALSSSLAHAFGSPEHLVAAVAVIGAVAAVVALMARFNAKFAARRAK